MHTRACAGVSECVCVCVSRQIRVSFELYWFIDFLYFNPDFPLISGGICAPSLPQAR